MKVGQKKHIPGVFPVTTADSVYVNTNKLGGSNLTLQEVLDNINPTKIYNFSGAYKSSKL